MVNTPSSLETLSRDMFETLARTFPIACATDEFFYFPQIRLPEVEWEAWDDFSGDSVTETIRRLSAWEDALDLLASHPSDPDEQIDIRRLQKMARTLREQLSEVRFWETQPTFYLTLVCIGLAEALEAEDPAAKRKRTRNLPAFLDKAGCNLKRMPVLFRDLGLEMLSDTRDYLLSLQEILPEIRPAFKALERFDKAIRQGSTRDDFILPDELLERIIRSHIHCDMDIREINRTLDQEIREMQEIMEQEAGNLLSKGASGYHLKGLKEALEKIPMPPLGKEGLLGLYRGAVDSLTEHCLEQGVVPPDLPSSCPVRVAPMPSYLSAIRTASSYSIPPKHPPSGGTFYIVNTHMPDEAKQGYQLEYRMLSAHETYPGHHLLDSFRWGLERPCRRAVEQPIFYEGWACFSEEVMRLTGYFSGPADRLLLAKRRLWRAIRGKVDIGLQTGSMDFETAAGYLGKTGIGMKRALSSVRKYPLNPGYRLCYTLGIRRFLSLFQRYGKNHLKKFVHTVLSQGEINFADLEKILENINHRTPPAAGY
ncbi:MAG: DUF885 family protein [bacterium]